MKKRWFVTALLALTLCVCSAPALAAVESGGVKYLWYTEDGDKTRGDNWEVTSFGGQKFFLSNDGGVSYTQLPEFQETSRQNWTEYDVRVSPLEGGGLRIEGRSAYGEAGTPYTLHWDYSADQLAAHLAGAEPNPVKELVNNGTVRVGRRTVYDYADGDETQHPVASINYHRGYENQLVWSTDGEHWSLCQYPEDFTYSYNMEGWWDGTFYLRKDNYLPDGYTSPDGVSWSYLEELPIISKLCLTADCGKYHFEVVLPNGSNGWYNEVYLMEGNERDRGVLLPHMGEGIRARGLGVNGLTAVPGPNDTVTLTVSGYDSASGHDGSFSLDYPISSLDWCLENLSKPFRETTQFAAEVSYGGLTLAKVAEHHRNANSYEQEGELIRNDGTGWKKVENTPFSCVFRLLPFNGKTFLIEDNATGRHRLYASADGLAWTEVTALRPQDMEGYVKDYVKYAMTWTGNGYLACREAGSYGNRAGGKLYEGNTSVYLLDENFALVNTYDFGRNVQAVGFQDGVYYAQVSESEGIQWRGSYNVSHDENGNTVYDTEPGYYNQYAPATLYRSTDGKTWERTGMLQIQDALRENEGGVAAIGTAKREVGPEGAADLGNFHFYLDYEEVPIDQRNPAGRRPTVMVTSENGYGGPVPGAGEAIQNAWITPGLLSVRLDEAGQVELTIQDLFGGGMKAVVSCGTGELDEITASGGDRWYEVYDNKATHSNETWLTLHEVSGSGYTRGEDRELIWSRVGGDEAYTYGSNVLDCTLGLLRLTRDVPWSGRILLLPYNGKTFLIYDRNSGEFYASENGLEWKKAEVDWINSHRDFLSGGREGSLGYSFVWTGDRYLVSCDLHTLNEEKWEYEYHPDNTKALLLDEDFQLVGSYDFGRPVEAVGFLDGVYYARLSSSSENTVQNAIELYRSTDGVNWEKTEALYLRDGLTPVG